MCKKCICLIRVSTQKQDLDAQREKVIANAIADGYKKSEIVLVEKKESAIKLSEMERESLYTIQKAVQNDNRTDEYKAFIAQNNAQINAIKEMLSRVEERQRKAFKMYLDGKVTDSIYNEQIEIINKEIEDWNKQIAKLESENKRLAFETSEMCEKTQWSSTDLDNIDSLEVKKEIINSVIKEIEVYKEDKGVYKLYVACADIKVQKIYQELRQEFTYKVSGHKITLLDKILENGKYVTRDITKYIKTNETPDLLISSIE